MNRAGFARARLALANERFSEAYEHLVRIFDPTGVAFHPFVRGWALADLADAAVRGQGDLDLVRAYLAEWEQIATETHAPHLEVQLAYAKLVNNANAAAFLPRVKAPVLGLYPTDGPITSADQERMLVENLRDFTVVHLPTRYHMVHHIAPGTCATALLHFVSQHDGMPCREA